MIVGTNGAGKSTILDALCFSLYGKSFRKIKKDQLINTTNEKGAVVEIEFNVNPMFDASFRKTSHAAVVNNGDLSDRIMAKDAWSIFAFFK